MMEPFLRSPKNGTIIAKSKAVFTSGNQTHFIIWAHLDILTSYVSKIIFEQIEATLFAHVNLALSI